MPTEFLGAACMVELKMLIRQSNRLNKSPMRPGIAFNGNSGRANKPLEEQKVDIYHL